MIATKSFGTLRNKIRRVGESFNWWWDGLMTTTKLFLKARQGKATTKLNNEIQRIAFVLSYRLSSHSYQEKSIQLFKLSRRGIHPTSYTMYIHSFHQILIMILVQYAFARSLSLCAGYGLVFIVYVELSFNQSSDQFTKIDNFNF